ncbi:TPA: helix-turn-helix domain-containing protein [Enterococcus faecium]|nr:helix-turn-helix transcriptional regulator [Enterococcus faecium]HBC8932763.1 helix-turn-helix transcriptional regulator [Enterococcus faecium]HBK6975385.1 helix-turn-helix transcriptional regulator [Enterococcus faecium]HEG1097378.1 helix-turn-helix transcriptional regulator [Enterococcus faecium]HEN1880641.1 helix-turn-helix transcriptional regulator [Enterococcus faecium]
MKPNPSEAGKRIKQLRLSCGFTMEELGRKIDNSPRATISNWERGTNLPNPQKLKLLSTITNSTIDWIKWGTLEEYITSYLIDIGYELYIKDFPEIPHKVFNDIQERYSNTFSLNKDYELLNPIIKNIFTKYYSKDFEDYRDIEVKPDLGLTDDNKNIKMIGQRIRKIRKKENITLEEFGKLFSPTADKAVISNWENGKNLPNSERIKKIAEIGGVSELYLMTGVDSSVAESMYFLSEVALDALERLSIEEVNRIIESFAGYLNVISKIDDPDKREISLNAICQLSLLDKMG